jgi:tetratricopeptide (TPR) repeat protein
MSERAQLHLASINEIISIQNPTADDEQRFLNEVEQARFFIDEAISQDPTNPFNYAILAGVYSALAVAGVDEAQDRVTSSLETAMALDPLNPGYHLIGAQMAARTGDTGTAREEIEKALTLKSNFTDALFLSAQLDINDGNVTSAIATTRSIITLEPRNPTRYFQLGMLLSAEGSSQESIIAFLTAIQLDPEYANARYLLALAYLADGQSDLALEQLEIVERTNPDNEEVKELKRQITNDEAFVSPELGFEVPVNDIASSNNFELEGQEIIDSSSLDIPLDLFNNEDAEVTE